MKQLIIGVFVFLIANNTFAQNKILVFYDAANTSEAKILWENGHARKVILDTLSNPARFTENNLKNYHVLVFLNTSINRLNFRQSLEVQRFMQAGGGFVGVGKAAEKTYRWLWYEKMLGGALAETQLENKLQLNLITNASIGKIELPPLWKAEDKPLIFDYIPTKCKPVLLDIMGKTWAWYYNTEEGGRMFYTALGVEPAIYNNTDFLNHVWSGIGEVSAKTALDYVKIASTALPLEKNFLKITLSDSLQNPLALAVTKENQVILVEQEGNIKMYKPQKRKFYTIGKLAIANLRGIKLDPEYSQNGSIYTFSQSSPDEYKIGRMQIVGDSLAIMTDFSSQSNNPLPKNIIYDFDRSARGPYRLPKYFDKKSFRFDNEQGMLLETFDEDSNVKNIEPFLEDTKFNFIQDMAFGADGALYFLENGQLHKLDYSETNRKPLAVASADIVTGNLPLKVKFSSAGSIDYDKADVLNFEWNFDGLNLSSEPNPEFTFTKPGTYEVKLKVSDNHGESAETSLKIQVNKAPVKRR